MLFKTERGIEIELSDHDVKKIIGTKNLSGTNFDKMQEYFKKMHAKAIKEMEHISEHIITDEDSIDLAVEYVAKYGSYKDFVKFLRYQMDHNLAYHILESVK